MSASFEPTTHRAAVGNDLLVRGLQLVRPMVSGDKLLSGSSRIVESRDDMATRFGALLLFALCAGFAAWIASLRT